MYCLCGLCLRAGERPFKCGQCDKAFNQKSALQVHMVKHTGKKPFKCEVCSIRFTQKSNMKHHMKRSHGYGEQLTCIAPEHTHKLHHQHQWAQPAVCAAVQRKTVIGSRQRVCLLQPQATSVQLVTHSD